MTLRWPARKAATMAGVLAALLYALIAGFSIPAQRTFFMLAVFAITLWSGRKIAISQVLAIALLVVIAIDPWAVLAPGFWLSFGAVAIIAFALSGRLRRPGWLREAMLIQWAITIGLIPLLLVLFQQVSIISPLANAVAIPVVSLIVVPLTLAGGLLQIGWLLSLAHGVLQLCMTFLAWLAQLPLNTWQQHTPLLWTLPIALAGAIWLLLPRGFPMRWVGLIGFLPMFLVQPQGLRHGAMRADVLDVGQGLAVVMRTANHAMLYDAGPQYSSESDSGARIVVPFLRGEGIRQLDGIVVSHNDLDHSGGLQSVITQVPVGWLVSSLPKDLATINVPHKPCVAGQSWEWDGVRFSMLYPESDSPDGRIKDNNRSCVLKVSSGYGSLLLTGDIEHKAEKDLVRKYGELLAAEVLVVPHHGSKTSSTPVFVNSVDPQAAIFTVGYRNRFGHPKQDVEERYIKAGSNILRSDYDGAVIVNYGAHGISIARQRTQARRYWHDSYAREAGLLAENEGAR